MQFFDHFDTFSLFKKNTNNVPELSNPSWENFYDTVIESNIRAGNFSDYFCMKLQKEWYQGEKPYYHIYPAIFPMVEKLRLDVHCNQLKLPIRDLSVRFPSDVDHQYKIGNTVLHHFFCRHISSKEFKDSVAKFAELNPKFIMGENPDNDYIFFFISSTEPETKQKELHVAYFALPLSDSVTVEESFVDRQPLPIDGSGNENDAQTKSFFVAVLRFCAAICLIGNDPDLVTPDILAKDREKFNRANDEQKKLIIDRAVRRGKNGFLLGANLEMIPHYRRPHLALVWTGEGKKIPKIVMRKGSVVHREKIVEVPSGFDRKATG
jgi:hypothetical protein